MEQTLRDLRRASKKTAAEVAEALHVSAQTVYRYEYGSRCIDIQQALDLAHYYEITVEEVIQAQLESIRIRKTD